jgi:peptide subunit release factor 1 (eRF1)
MGQSSYFGRCTLSFARSATPELRQSVESRWPKGHRLGARRARRSTRKLDVERAHTFVAYDPRTEELLAVAAHNEDNRARLAFLLAVRGAQALPRATARAGGCA